MPSRVLRSKTFLVVELCIVAMIGAIIWTKLGQLPVDDLQLKPECYGELMSKYPHSHSQ